MKKIIYILLIVSISFSYTSVFAYDYVNPENESLVNSQKTEIYDRKSMYEFLAGEDDEEEELEYTAFSSNQMWWPIGSKKTTKVDGKIFATGEPEFLGTNSGYGDKESFRIKEHGGVDIAGGTTVGYTNVIAAKDGVVTYSSKKLSQCPTGYYGSGCGGGYGNYVIIKHSDGYSTVYAHLYQDSITVDVGENVKQGQVIGKMGSSGSSTGNHLHFEVRDPNNNPLNPLDYIDMKNPRPMGSSSDFLQSLKNAESSSEPPFCDKEKKYYKVYKVLNETYNTVGYGIYLDGKEESLTKYGGDPKKTNVGDCQLVTAVDSLMLEVANYRRKEVQKMAKKNSITLKQHQEDALVIHLYQTGNSYLAKTNEFARIYKSSADPKDLGAFFMGYHSAEGVRKRRCYVWKLYYKGKYFADKSPFNDSEDNACSNLY